MLNPAGDIFVEPTEGQLKTATYWRATIDGGMFPGT